MSLLPPLYSCLPFGSIYRIEYTPTSVITLQAFVSEYAVTGSDAGTGSLLAAIAEAGFLIGLEKNRFLILNIMIMSRNISYLMHVTDDFLMF